MRRSRTARSDQGFSMVELMVALVVTLMVTGAVFQLMSAGSTAFRREPEIADRQQSIRVAMDRIWTDTLQAGTGMPAFSQVFDRSLDGVGSMGAIGTATDELGFIKMGECPPLTICGNTNGASVTTKEELSSCYKLPALVILGRSASATEPAAYGVFWAEMPGGGGEFLVQPGWREWVPKWPCRVPQGQRGRIQPARREVRVRATVHGRGRRGPLPCRARDGRHARAVEKLQG